MSQHPELPYEQAKNREYLARLAAKPPSTVGVSIPRSRKWVDPSSIRLASRRALHPLVGRIGFNAEDEFLGRSCYVGPSRMDDGEFQVVSWDAPIARLFYGDGGEGYVIDGELAVRRTFDHHVDDVTDIDDEWLDRVEPSPFAMAQLDVPAPASSRRGRPSRATTPVDEEADEATHRRRDALGDVNNPDQAAEDAGGPPCVAAPQQAPGRVPDRAQLNRMRAEEVVLKKLAAPRSDALSSVLATLQPDQFEVVSRPPGTSLIVQGHPGTGKTVVAAYRAAYLVSPERNENQAASVLLVGPTSDYVAHVSGLLRPLDPEGRVVVTHVAEVLDRTVDLKSQWSGGIGGDHDDIDARARQFASRAERLLKANEALPSGPTARRDHLQAIYSLMRSNGLPDAPLSDDPEDAAWMGRLPDFDRAIRLRRYLPLMAQITLAFQPVPFTDQFPHLLIDEAQDISPIEWNVLEQHLRPDGRWTLVGDMNQRRSDATYASWSDISDHLGLGDGDDPLSPVILRRGYRSTTPILQFADKLLPAKERGASSIQNDGPMPAVERVVAERSLVEKAVEHARRLIRAYPNGTVAIVSVDPGPLIQWLGKAGWRRGETLNLWAKDDEVLRVHVPESTRGLEFDGVVVVEPGAFPENLGRDGQLYTSLTRANRELAVVWHRGLPDALRKLGRR